jgi:hypothetical protein
MKIRKLTKHDAENYRNIRLEALDNNPDSFGTMYHEEAMKTVDEFRDKIPENHNNFILGCYEDKELIGIVSFHLFFSIF